MKIAVIGCGSIGERHALNALAFGEVCIVDPDKQRTEALAAKGATVFADVDAALDWSPDGIVIATPNASHIDIAIQCLETSASILIEKPLTTSMKKVRSLLSIATKKRNNEKIYGVCNLRFHPGPAALKRHLDKIGKPLFSRIHFGSYLPAMRPNRDYKTIYASNYEEGGGVVLDTIHEIDLASWLLGPIERAGGASARLSDLEINVEDYAEIHLVHATGVRSQVHMNYLQRLKTRGCEIVGTEASLLWSSIGKRPEHMSVDLLAKDEKVTSLEKIPSVNSADMYTDLMSAFVHSIQDPSSSELQTLEEAIATLSTALSIRIKPDSREHWQNIEDTTE
jgi:predicted dehydrogenase